MNNYNERLEQQLFRALTKGGLEKEKEIESKGRYIHRPMKSIVHEEIEALTSLIKELVTEAKPEERELIEPVTGKPVSRGDKVTFDVEADPRGSLIFVQNNGYNMALNQFEQNLLKALEEV